MSAAGGPPAGPEAPPPAGDSPAAAASPPAPRTVDPPVHVRFRLNDGVRVAGDLTAWDERGLDGSFGRRRWSDVEAEDARAVLRRLIDEAVADDWIAFGEVMLALDGEEAWAERGFDRALRLDRGAAGRVEQARARVAARRAEQEERARALEAERLSTLHPEAAPWPSTPWPPLTDAERAEATDRMRAEARSLLRQTGAVIAPVESTHFLVYSDMPRRETAAWALRLDDLHGWLGTLFGLPAGGSVFEGKAVVFAFTERDRFQLLEAQGFGHLARRDDDGFCHPQGPRVFLNVVRDPDDEVFSGTLMRVATHGFMHRYLTPRRLPAWANDGLALVAHAAVLGGSWVERRVRREGLRFVREGGSVDAVLSLRYADDAWPGPREVGPAVGYLVTDLMITDQPAAYVRWVNAVKAGKDWTAALPEDFGAARGQLVATVVQFYMVND